MLSAPASTPDDHSAAVGADPSPAAADRGSEYANAGEAGLTASAGTPQALSVCDRSRHASSSEGLAGRLQGRLHLGRCSAEGAGLCEGKPPGSCLGHSSGASLQFRLLYIDIAKIILLRPASTCQQFIVDLIFPPRQGLCWLLEMHGAIAWKCLEALPTSCGRMGKQ